MTTSVAGDDACAGENCECPIFPGPGNVRIPLNFSDLPNVPEFMPFWDSSVPQKFLWIPVPWIRWGFSEFANTFELSAEICKFASTRWRPPAASQSFRDFLKNNSYCANGPIGPIAQHCAPLVPLGTYGVITWRPRVRLIGSVRMFYLVFILFSKVFIWSHIVFDRILYVGIHMILNVGIYMITNVAVIWLRMSQLHDYECRG